MKRPLTEQRTSVCRRTAVRHLCWLLLIWLGTLTGAGAATFDLREAHMTAVISGSVTQSVVTLPYNWDKRHKGQEGSATFDIAFSLSPEFRPESESKPEQPSSSPITLYAAYFVRLGNAYEVLLNGVVIERRGDLQAFNSADFGLVPRTLALPLHLLKKDNLLRVRIRADAGRRAGVPVVVVGPDHEIDALYKSAHKWRVTSSQVIVVLSLLVSALALALWFTQTEPNHLGHPVRDKLYLFAGLAELCWAWRVSMVLVEQPTLPWLVWGTLYIAALGGWACFMTAFCCMAAGWSDRPWLPRFFSLLWALIIGGVLATFAAYYLHFWHLPWLLTLWYGLLVLMVVSFAVIFCVATVKNPLAMRVPVAIALVLNVLVGLRDWVVFRLTDSFGADTMLRYSSAVFGLTLAHIVMMRFRLANTQARDLNANLAARVAQREQELAQSYQQVEQLAREQERTGERTRILRDMHDGVGAHISTAIRQLESGRASTGELLQTLRDSLDQLKLSIDAMNVPQGDIAALMASLRYRLEPRFTASDITLQWDVDVLAPLAGFDHKAMQHLQFMVFEALSNVLQHANASALRIELHATDHGGTQLRITDNGCGFDPKRVSSKGLGSLRERAAIIGAKLVIASEPGRSVVDITLAQPGATGAVQSGE